MIADIKTARLNAGLKRHEFARRVGVSAVAVWKWETGKTQPTVGKNDSDYQVCRNNQGRLALVGLTCQGWRFALEEKAPR